MKTSLHRILTKDNIELVGLLYEPDHVTQKILVHVHGLAGNFYENKFLDVVAKTLTSNGVAFFAFNNRGCEIIKYLTKMNREKRDITQIGNAYEKFIDSWIDIEAAVGFIEQRGFTEIHLAGHSLGCSKVAYYVTETQDPRLHSVLFLSPADMVGLGKQDKDFVRDSTMAEAMMREGRGNELIPYAVWEGCRLTAATFLDLSSEASKVAIFNFYNPKDSLPVLGKITIPAFVVMGRQDGALTVPIEETMERLKKAATSSPNVATVILGDAGHDYNNYEQQLADSILQWIQKLYDPVLI